MELMYKGLQFKMRQENDAYIIEVFDEKGITMTYPHMNVHIHN